MSDCGHEKIILQLQEKVKQLTQKLSYYENPHSPTIKKLSWMEKTKTRCKKNRDSDSSKSKRGGIPGHNGATQKFNPTSTTQIAMCKLNCAPREV